MDPGYGHDCGHLICQHRIEVEVWPATAEVCFSDERFVHPFNSKVQFEAHVFNAPTNRVIWKVHSLDGGAGAGHIDAGGLYLAPQKAPPLNCFTGFTEIVEATSVDDPFRRAYARVSVTGLGPPPPPVPRLEVYPRRVHLYYPLYYPEGAQNNYIDSSNTMQLFRALVWNASASDVKWSIDGGLTIVFTGPEYLLNSEYLYALSGSGSLKIVQIQAELPGVTDHATVSLLNYTWPGIA